MKHDFTVKNIHGQVICSRCGKPELYARKSPCNETPSSDAPVERLVIWHTPDKDNPPSETMLVAVQTNKGFDTALVYVDDDGITLIEPEYHDVWTAWNWNNVTKYALLSELLSTI